VGLGRLFTLLMAGMLSITAARPAFAAPKAASPPAQATIDIRQPASVRLMNDLNFAYLTVTAAGTAVVNPDTDAMTTTGGVVRIAGTPYAAQFEAVSPVKGVVHIRAPKTPTTLTRVGGSETMTVTNFVVSGSGTRNANAKEPFAFKVGGTLNVNASQVEGLYTGTFIVDVQYP
jgi:hypothetical protein